LSETTGVPREGIDDPKMAGIFYRDVFGLTVYPISDSDNAMIGMPDQQWFGVSAKQPKVPGWWNPVIQVDLISRIRLYTLP
jgi:hypothetical protein